MNTVRRPVAEPGLRARPLGVATWSVCATPLFSIQRANAPHCWAGRSSGRYAASHLPAQQVDHDLREFPRHRYSEQDLDAFRRSFTGQVITAPDADCYSAPSLWNGCFDQRPAAIARCFSSAGPSRRDRFRPAARPRCRHGVRLHRLGARCRRGIQGIGSFTRWATQPVGVDRAEIQLIGQSVGSRTRSNTTSSGGWQCYPTLTSISPGAKQIRRSRCAVVDTG
jgi:hypothetical protein